MVGHLAFLYGDERADGVWARLEAILDGFQLHNPIAAERSAPTLSERDVILITYGDQFQEPGVTALHTLYTLLTKTLGRVVTGVHILPFFPYSSDDGFSVIDYTQVNPDLGAWDDIERLGRDFCLMVDGVVNHVSRQSNWFERYCAGDPCYADWFITVPAGADLSMVVRPRALPLLHPVQTADGERWVWTTFSEDQIDLNYAHPPVLLRMIEVLLFYVEKGARIIRLDAIAYLWKEIGTPCIHLPQAHCVVKLLRTVLDAVAPHVLLITETNVPHEENVSYFGKPLPDTGITDEAQMVYQFPLAPLVMHSILSGDARVISGWAAGLETPSRHATFFNFTASHDGIGVMPACGLLSEGDIQNLVDTTLAHGGQVSDKANADGSRSVYELNISYFDALSDPQADETLETQVRRFMVGQAVMLALAGVPGIYVHSLLGSRSWHEGVAETGRARSVNREKFDRARLELELADPYSLRHQVVTAYRALLQARTSEPAFHPEGPQRVLRLHEAVFALLRTSIDAQRHVLCLHNVSPAAVEVGLVPTALHTPPGVWQNLLSGDELSVGEGGIRLRLPPYAVAWLRRHTN
jgi:sucrose phosphorylase